MVLLYGIPGEGPFELVADALEEIHCPYVILDQRRFKEIDFIIQLSNEGCNGELSIGHLSYSLNQFTGIYNRSVDFNSLPGVKEKTHSSPETDKYAQLFELLHVWIEQSDTRVVNKTSAMSSNASKPFQLQLIQPYFNIPETLITNNVEEVFGFEDLVGNIICKSASSVRSIVSTITAKNNSSIKNIQSCSTLFQQQLKGTNYRVHVVDKEVFAIRADTETVDYRYSHREGKETMLSAVNLDDVIRKKCIALARDLGLPFAGIDLFLSDGGEWYCFEVNPSPGFSYFELTTEQPIARSVAHYLSGSGLDE